MKTNLRLAVVCLTACLSPAAFADDICDGGTPAKAKADAQVRQAQDMEKAGRARDAYSAASRADADCVSNLKELDALKKRTAKVIAADEEKKSRIKEAFDWYRSAGSPADADRMQRKLVDAKPDDINTVSAAIDYFRQISDSAQEKAMRAHATKNVEKALAAEEKQFAASPSGTASLSHLRLARDWSYYAGGGQEAAMARADKRGDSVMKDDTRFALQAALDYYNFAEKKDKMQRVRDKARALGDRALAKGEAELAVEYLRIAGDNAKAEGLRRQTEGKAAQSEAARKKAFSKEQDSLEKELGFK